MKPFLVLTLISAGKQKPSWWTNAATFIKFGRLDRADALSHANNSLEASSVWKIPCILNSKLDCLHHSFTDIWGIRSCSYPETISGTRANVGVPHLTLMKNGFKFYEIFSAVEKCMNFSDDNFREIVFCRHNFCHAFLAYHNSIINEI